MKPLHRSTLVFCLLSTFAALGTGCPGATRGAGATAEPPRAEPLAGLDERVARAMEAFHVPGLALAVVHDDEVVVTRGYGVRRPGEEGAVGPDTVFAIASNTKPFVATVVAALVEEGALGWEDRVSERLPWLRLHDEAATRELRLVDLLAHRSGLATFAGDLIWIGSRFGTEEVLRRLAAIEPETGLRLRYGYSNMMFVAAGEVVRAVTGQGWDEAVQRRLLEPLGMSRTVTSVSALESMEDVATPTMPVDGEAVLLPYLDMGAAGAAGGLCSSARDMAAWLRMQLANGRLGARQIVPAEAIAATRRPETPIPLPPSSAALYPSRHFLAYGLGWFLNDYRGRLVVSHGGGLPGMTSLVALLPEESLGVVVLTNGESAAPRALVMEIVDAFLGGEGTDWTAALVAATVEAEGETEAAAEPTAPSLPLAAYVGRYGNAALGAAEVVEVEGGLALRLPDHGGLEGALRPYRGDTMRCAWTDPVFLESDVAFDVADGQVRSLGFAVRPDFVDPVVYVFARDDEGGL